MLVRVAARVVPVGSPFEKGKTMWTKTALRFLAVTALLAGGWSANSARAAKPSSTPAQVVFANASGDRITSSGDPSYRNGEQGVSCILNDNGNLVLHASSSHPINVQFGTPYNTGCQLSPGGWIPPSLNAPTLTVLRLLEMQVGSTTATLAVFHLSDGQGRVMYGWPGYCSTSIQATRLDASTWIVAATPTPTAAGAGHIAVLEQFVSRRTNVPTSYWEMPFTITVTTLQ
jgi:hypothetical protein